MKQNNLKNNSIPELHHFVKVWYKGGVETFIKTLVDKRFLKKTVVGNDFKVFSYLFSIKERRDNDIFCFHTPLYFLSLSYAIIRGLNCKVIIHNDLQLLYSPFKKLIAYPWLFFLMFFGINVIYFNPSNSFLSKLSKNAVQGKYLDNFEIKRNVNISNERRNILFVGRYHHSKGFERALSMVSKLNKPCNFKVFGDFPEEVISAYSDDNISFFGFQEDLSRIYTDSSILLICSDYESGPLVAFEALSYGVPVLTTRVGVFQEMHKSEEFDYLTIYDSEEEGINFLNEFISLERFSSSKNLEFLKRYLNSVETFYDKFLI